MNSAPAEIDSDSVNAAAREPVKPAELREVMARFATGVTVLTVGGEHPHAMTANAFSSVSLEPASVLCGVGHSAVMHGALTSAGRFAVNILGTEQESLARHFADKKRVLGAAQFERVAWRPGELTGAPLLGGSLGWLECELSAAHSFGDHTIFIGTVIGAHRNTAGSGLLYVDGKFGKPEVPRG
ncbi:flavin reductase family protein [Streptomyces physcomitrii]|uniref:Putative oxidoreductase n=1 Tax=Streptomyces albus (strain ATCC 21838 / DSM 41398 / FERM P-419 / JCM 4703 / NBRC 107858) TaxID=1081613 RepID=A0A0B5EJX1_STRA4|nr:putative oxidoreductase [Streptomyces albus]AOU76907.1 putative oxidoreductase [Streptomyces albus]